VAAGQTSARLLTAKRRISLSTDKEMTLYYIAQEALNNVLRHAPKSVLVTLSRKKERVILEIADDGWASISRRWIVQAWASRTCAKSDSVERHIEDHYQADDGHQSGGYRPERPGH
jgi:hypothetical protein